VLYDVCQINPTETTGSITSGTASLVVANAATWSAGQGIKVAGAGASGAALTTTVSSIVGTTLTLAANAGTTVSSAVVSHTDDIFYPATQARLGLVDDDCLFSQSPDTYYANSEPVHITSYPTTPASASIPPLAVNGRGPKIAGDKFISAFYNDTTSQTRPLPRMDGFLPVQTITASTTYDGPGVRYIECNHSAPITITLPWPGWMLNTANEPIIIKDRSSSGASANSITIAAGSGATVNGSTYTINTDKGAVMLIPRSDNDYRVVAAYTGAAGNVTGPASATSTAIAKFDGTTGKILQNSGVTIDGSNNLTTAGNIQAARVTATSELVSGDGYFSGYFSSSSGAPTIAYRRGRGSSSSPSAVQSNDVLYYLSQSGYNGSGWVVGAYMYATATENWSGSANGANVTLTACPNGSTDGFAKGVRLDPTNASFEPIADASMDLGRSSFRYRDGRFSRDIHLGRQVQSGGSALSSSTSTGAGTSPTVVINGNGIAGSISLTTGTSPATSARIIELTMAASFTTNPVVIITPANAAAAALSGNKQVYVDDAAVLANKWSLKSGSTALDASTAYVWYFHVIGV
jgi:hypothetical protein